MVGVRVPHLPLFVIFKVFEPYIIFMYDMKYTKEYLQELVNKSTCFWDVVELAGVKRQEGNYRYISRKIYFYKINTDHFIDQRIGNSTNKKPLSKYLVKGKPLTLNGNRLKKRLYDSNLKKEECEFCQQGPIWNGKRISLILDHIDGDRTNNLLENLRILCPNCNATLDTHCGRNIKK